MIQTDFSLRAATSADEDILLRWRNLPEVYQFFKEARPVTEQEHQGWFRAVLARNDRAIFLGILREQEVGMVRLDFNSDLSSATVSVHLDPKFFGRGLGAQLLLAVERRAKKQYPRLVEFMAEIHEQNTTSMKTFEKCGYGPFDKANNFHIYRKSLR